MAKQKKFNVTGMCWISVLKGQKTALPPCIIWLRELRISFPESAERVKEKSYSWLTRWIKQPLILSFLVS